MPANALRSFLAGPPGRINLNLSFFMGCMTAAGLPPLGVPSFLLTFPWLMHALNGTQRRRDAFCGGWLFGMGYFMGGMYWTTAAYFNLFQSLPWLLPFSLIGFPAMIGLLWGVAALAAHACRGHLGVYAASFIACFTGIEFLRGAAFDFPWNLLGYNLYRLAPLLQAAAFGGVYLLTLLLLLCGAGIFLIAHGRRYFVPAGIIGALLCLTFCWGLLRTGASPDPGRGLAVHVLQPDIAHYDKADRSTALAALPGLLATLPATEDPSLFLFPETFITHHRDEGPRVYRDIMAQLPAHSFAALGVKRFVPGSGGEMDVYNSMVILNSTARVMATYDKTILAPWGERIPFETQLRSIPGLLADRRSLLPGTGAATLRLDGLAPFAPQICFESAYPGFTLSGAQRPEFILLAANDDWTRGTSQPYQSFLAARLRAIETGVPVIRAGNTGISAIIDGHGHIRHALDFGERGIISDTIPPPLPEPPYSRYGNLPLLALLIAWGITNAVFVRRSAR